MYMYFLAMSTYIRVNLQHEGHVTTHHALMIPFHELDDVLGLLVPEEDVPTVTSTHDKLTLKSIKVYTLHWMYKYIHK